MHALLHVIYLSSILSINFQRPVSFRMFLSVGRDMRNPKHSHEEYNVTIQFRRTISKMASQKLASILLHLLHLIVLVCLRQNTARGPDVARSASKSGPPNTIAFEPVMLHVICQILGPRVKTFARTPVLRPYK